MKYDIELIMLEIRNKKTIFIVPICFMWILFCPFLLNQAENIIINNLSVAIFFDYLQKILPIFILYYLYFFFKDFLEEETIEVVSSMNRKYKIKFVFYIFILYQIIVIPTYFIGFSYFESKIVCFEIMNIVFILLFISLSFYCVSYLCASSLIGFGVIVIYIFVFIMLMPYGCFLNIFHMSRTIVDVQTEYYIQHFLELILITFLGLWTENHIKL